MAQSTFHRSMYFALFYFMEHTETIESLQSEKIELQGKIADLILPFLNKYGFIKDMEVKLNKSTVDTYRGEHNFFDVEVNIIL